MFLGGDEVHLKRKAFDFILYRKIGYKHYNGVEEFHLKNSLSFLPIGVNTSIRNFLETYFGFNDNGVGVNVAACLHFVNGRI